jgi:hypothetical protein
MVPLKIAIFNEVRNKHEKSATFTDEQLDQVIFRSPKGLRLTYSGFLILKNIFTVYSFEMDISLTAKHQIGMNTLSYPYFMTAKRLMLFSEMDAMVVKLCGGIKQFLENQYNSEIAARQPG